MTDSVATPIDSTKSQTGHPLLAQFMVFLNGLILTITAFVTLSVFIEDMKANDVKASAAQLENSISEQFSNLQRDLNLLSPLLMAAPDQPLSEMLRLNLLEGLSRANVIAWKDNLRQQPAKIVFSTDKPADARGELTAMLGGMIGRASATPSDFAAYIVSTPDKQSRYVFLTASPRLPSTGQLAGVIVVAIKADRFLDWSILQAKHGDLKSLEILDQSDMTPIAQYKASQAVEPLSLSNAIKSTDINMTIGGRSLIARATFNSTGSVTILDYVPFLMLFFGLTLTLIGVLYVRSNQRQTKRLEEVNSLLRDRNRAFRKQMERTENLNETLKASERDFAAIINSVNDVIFETDKNGRLVFVNDAWSRLTGRHAEDCLGHTLFEYIYAQDASEPTDALHDMYTGKRADYRSFTRIVTIDNKPRFVELVFSLTRMDNSGNVRLVGMMTDIEERRQAELALRETERKYRTIVENAVSGLFQVAADGRFISANPALAKLLGYDSVPEMLQDPNCSKNNLFADPKDRDLMMRLVRRQSQVRAFEIRYKRRNGEIFWASENLRVITDQSGDILYYEGAIEDVSQRKEAEIGLQKAKLESDLANRAKTEFLANMSHELRTPLNAIIGFSDIIHEQSLGQIGTPAYLDYAREINAGGKQLLKIINEILDVSRIELSDKPHNESVIDLRKICDTCLTLVRGKGEDKMIVIDSHLPPQMPLIVGAETAFKQMVLNLLHNALAHTSQGGQISVEAIVDQDHSVRISVSDNGSGMSSEDVRNAMQPLDGSLPDDKDQQRTFGLSLVRSLIAQHNGRMEIISEKGVGTTATLIIPAARVIGLLDRADAHKTGGKLFS